MAVIKESSTHEVFFITASLFLITQERLYTLDKLISYLGSNSKSCKLIPKFSSLTLVILIS